MTIGLRGDPWGDVLDALKFDLASLKPDHLVLIASSESLGNARRLLDQVGFGEDRGEIVQIADANNLDEIFKETNVLIQRLAARGFRPDQIAINYTGGTKVMGSGAVLSAVYNKIKELRYIVYLGAARETAKAPKRRIVSTRPSAVFAYQDLLNGRGMLMDLRYRTALELLERIDEAFLSPEDRRRREDLIKLTKAYGEWDTFYPERFLEIYPEVAFGPESLQPLRLNAEQLALIRKVADEKQQGRFGPHVLTDLFNNAERRLMIGRTEDAMTRLYRVLEMLAQWVLLRDYEIDTNDADTRRIPPRDRVAFEALRSMEDGKVKIGMRKAFELLVVLDTPVGRGFQQSATLREFLDMRGQSILVHGLRPISAEDGHRYMEHARALFQIEIGEFLELARNLQFPWMVDRRPPTAALPED